MKNANKLWRDLVYRFADQSRCKSRKVGAILVKDGALIAEGWNSAPQGCTVDDCPRDKCNEQVVEKNKDGTVSIVSTFHIASSGQKLDQAVCTHAEANAIANCAKRGISTYGAHLYCTTFPCAECAKLIVSSGIIAVTYSDDYLSPLSRKIFDQASVIVDQFERNSRNET